MSPLEELRALLRPAGGGLYLVSTGRDEQLALQRRLYDASTDAEAEAKWLRALEEVASAEAFVIGIPSDVGAGFRRGANLGPLEIRSTLVNQLPDWPERLRGRGVVDVGDVFVVPQLLHDDMLSEGQKAATRAAIYPDVAPADRERLPVSPLSIAERALELLFALAPRAKPFVIGGDHSTAWPVAHALHRAKKGRWGIVQPDAHTDLLSERLGVKYCFATWSYHANELFGRDGRMVQVGTRASRHDRGHWESGLGVKQVWAEEWNRDPQAAIDGVIAHLKSVGVTSVYFSNDIDGTDSAWADATGTPEPGGLEPEALIELIRRLGKEIGILAGDVMEVAPALQDRPDSKTRTLGLAGRYVRETLGAMLGGPL